MYSLPVVSARVRRHISDKFVFNQMSLINIGVPERQAFDSTAEKMRDEIADSLSQQKDLYAKLQNPRVKDYYTKIFLASWADSSRDRFLYQNFSGKAPAGGHITLDDIMRPDFGIPEENEPGEGEGEDKDITHDGSRDRSF